MTVAFNAHNYPTFSAAEFEQRRVSLRAIMEELEVGLCVVHGERGAPAVAWVTGWFPTHAAWALVHRGGDVRLLVQRFNHVATAQRMVGPGTTVAFGGPEGIATMVEAVVAATRPGERVGWVGPLAAATLRTLTDAQRVVVPLGEHFQRLRMSKSAEELAWMRAGAALTDRALDALLDVLSDGPTEWEAMAAVEASYLGHGGTNHLHYIASTPMDAPERYVPAQWPSGRRIGDGDAVVTELSASFWGYPGQVLRSIAVGVEPSSVFRELHDVAEECFRRVAGLIRPGTHAAELVDAADVIAEAGFVLGDDLLHGFGGGYLPPVLRTRADEIDPIPDLRLEVGMTVVLQPNVCTTDRRAGVQTGELLLVTTDGHESLHRAPKGFLRV